MLTKTDLSRIKKIIREEIETETANLATSLRSEIKLARMEIQNDIKNLSGRMKDLGIQVKDLGIVAKSTQKDLKRIENKIDKSIDFLDKDYLAMKKRVEVIEQHINISH